MKERVSKIGFLSTDELTNNELELITEVAENSSISISKVDCISELDLLLCFNDATVLRLPRNFDKIPTVLVVELPGDNSFFAQVTLHKLDEIIRDIVAGNYHTSRRQLISIDIENRKVTGLNDIYISSSVINNRMRYDLYIDNQSIVEHADSANALLISTPTGSTAMALNLGGALIHPDAEVFQIQAIASRNFMIKQQIVSSNSIIQVELLDISKTVTIQVDNDKYTSESREYTIYKDDRYIEFVIIDNNTNNLQNKLENKISFEDTHDLTSSAKFVLHILMTENRSMTINQIMEITHISNQKTIRSALKLLTSKKFIIRKDNLEDMREHLYHYAAY